MKTWTFAASSFVMLLLSSAALAQPVDTYVSGLLHHPLGGITDLTVDGRRLTACCLGSSGEDGVEVQFNSLYGGGVSVDLASMLGATGVQREIRVRPKGWDGTIKGTLRLISDPDGIVTEVYDFSAIGASELQWRLLDEHGGVLAEGVAAGPVLGWGLDLVPVPGLTARKEYRVQASGSGRRAAQGFFDVAATVTGLTSGPITGVQAIEVTPVPCLGCPPDPWSDLQSFELTADGIPDLVLVDAHLTTFDLVSWGLGQAHLAEECIGFPPPCAGTDRGLQVGNLGSSGQDGVAVALPPGNGGVSVALAKGNCCRGHVIIMKAFDDEGQELRVSMTQTTDPTGIEELDADFSALGADGFRLRLFDSNGAALGPPEGTAFYGGGPKPTFSANCPPGYREIWENIGTPANPVWVFTGCVGLYEFVLPGVGTVPGVASFSVEPLNATSSFGERTRCEILSDDDEGLVITGVTVLPQTAYVSGLLHTALGTAQLDPPTDRRLPVRNLGSSGEDGVEITLHSASGGGAEIDLDPFLGTPGATLRHKHKGWDGLIYGNHRMVSNGDGSAMYTFDYSDVGATSIEIVQLDKNGRVIFSETYPGPIVDFPLNAEVFICPPGFYSGWSVYTGQVCPTCPILTFIIHYCSGTTFTQFVVTPTFPPGTPESPGFESLSITGSGVPELAVSNAHVRTFGNPSWGEGQAHISEECTPDSMGSCDESDRRLVVSNLGSSGQDGVSVGVGPNAGGLAVATAKGNCCRGHVIIMKLYDDEGQEQRISRTQIDELAPVEELDADFSSLGASGYRLTLFDESGVVIGPPGGTEFLSGGPKPTFTNLCAVGQTEWWVNQGTPSNPVWVFYGCTGGYEFVLPGYGAVGGVNSWRIEPLGATSSVGRLTQCTLTSDDPQGLILDDVAVTFVAKGDLDWNGVVDHADFVVIADCMSGPNVTSPPAGCDAGAFSRADLDIDEDVDLADFAEFQVAFPGG